jgi:hypothetical protein
VSGPKSLFPKEAAMADWSLQALLAEMDDDVQRRLATARTAFGSTGAAGNGSDRAWIELLNTYLPKRYEAATAYIVDSLGTFSQQADVVIFDRQDSPFVFYYQGQMVVPIESVYAVFEAKPTANAVLLRYAQKKAASVRTLRRTTLQTQQPGRGPLAKPLAPIMCGLLTFETDWQPALGFEFEKALEADLGKGRLDIGCIAEHGHFTYDDNEKRHKLVTGMKPATSFLFKLIEKLQIIGTAPLVNVEAYSKWLAK